ncbi:MAG: hypothetical protein WA020_16965 [Candidatus Acidiferrales bacterium]
MHDPLVQYLVGVGILSVGLVILLSSAEIAHSLGRFWERWTGRRPHAAAGDNRDPAPPFYRARLVIWRALGLLIVADGLIWLGLATAEVFHLLPRSSR